MPLLSPGDLDPGALGIPPRLTWLLWWALVTSSMRPTRSVVDTPCVRLHSLGDRAGVGSQPGTLGRLSPATTTRDTSGPAVAEPTAAPKTRVPSLRKAITEDLGWERGEGFHAFTD